MEMRPDRLLTVRKTQSWTPEASRAGLTEALVLVVSFSFPSDPCYTNAARILTLLGDAVSSEKEQTEDRENGLSPSFPGATDDLWLLLVAPLLSGRDGKGEHEQGETELSKLTTCLVGVLSLSMDYHRKTNAVDYERAV